MLKMTIDNEEVVSKNDFTIKEEMLSASSTILNNTYPKSWEDDKDYISRFYYPKDYAKLNIQNFSIEPEEAGTTIQVNGSATLTDVDTTKESRVLKLLGQTSQTTISGKNLFDIATNTSGNYATNTNISSISGNTMVLNGAGGASSRVIRLQNQVANKTYTVSFNTDITTNRILVRIRKSDDSGWITNSDITWSGWTYNTTYAAWYYSANASNNKATFTFTVPSGLYWQFGIVNVNSTSATFSNIQLEESSSATTYEPYVGGIPSPNPQFPEPVQVVSGDNEINVCGKNLFNKDTPVNSTFTASIPTALQHFKDTGEFATGYLDTQANNRIVANIGYRTCFIKTQVGKTYTLYPRYDVKNDWNFVQVFALDDSGNIISYSNRWLLTPYTHTMASNENYLAFSVRQDSTYQVADTTQVEVGSTATTYEAYIGETYPLYLGVLGKNLFTSKVEQGAVNQSIGSTYEQCKTTNLTRIRTEELIRIKEGTSYTFSFNSPYSVAVFPFDQNRKMISPPTNYGAWKPSTFTIDTTGVYYIALSFKKSPDGNITPAEINNIQLMFEAGTTASTYEAPNPLELCKIGTYQDKIYKGEGTNLLENTNTTQTISGITFTKNDNGSVELSGTSNAVADYYLKGSASDYVDLGLPSGTYNLSGCINGSGSTYMLYVVQNRNGSLTYLQSINTTGLNITIQNGDTFRIFIRVMSSQTPNTTISPMINEGTTALPYEPYNAKDKWLLHKEIGKVVLDGSQQITITNWRPTANSVGWVYPYNITNNTPSGSTSSVASVISNKLIPSNIDDLYNGIINNGVGLWQNNSYGIVIRTSDTSLTNTTLINTYLSNNNILVYFPLATPTATEITDTTLISQLDALESQ